MLNRMKARHLGPTSVKLRLYKTLFKDLVALFSKNTINISHTKKYKMCLKVKVYPMMRKISTQGLVAITYYLQARAIQSYVSVFIL